MKKQIRQEFKEIRDSIFSEEKSNQVIQELLDDPDYISAKTVMFYVSKGTEVNTQELIKKVLAEKEKTVLVPKIFDERMIAVEIKSFDELKPGQYDILEPQSDEEWTKEIDVIIVPLLVFNSDLDRIGYGKGYYDKFLTTEQGKAGIKMGLAFKEQEYQGFIPTEDHDEKLDYIITD